MLTAGLRKFSRAVMPMAPGTGKGGGGARDADGPPSRRSEKSKQERRSPIKKVCDPVRPIPSQPSPTSAVNARRLLRFRVLQAGK